MGYCIELLDGKVVIPGPNVHTVYEIMCELNRTKHNLKHGRASSGGIVTSRYFMWMHPDYPRYCKDAKDVFYELRFGSHYPDNSDDLIVDEFLGEKIGQEELFFSAIAHLVHPDSFMEWEGEDGYQWRWTFRNLELETESIRSPRY